MVFSVITDLTQSAKNFGNKTFLTDGSTDLSFSELYERVKKSASALHDLGVRSGDRVGICMSKSADQVVAILAVLHANAIFVPILPSLKRDNINHIVSDSNMSIIIVDNNRLKEVLNLEVEARIVMGSGNLSDDYPYLPYIAKYHSGCNSPEFNRIGIDVAAIIYSSGSTGRPKGIMVTHRNLYDGARIVAEYLQTTEFDRIACILSFNFDYGLNQIWQALFTGASIHLHELVMPNDCMRFIAQEQITSLPLMPVIMTRLFDSRFFDRKQNYDLSKVRYVCSSGGRISSEMLSNIMSAFPGASIYAMYGLTEAFRSTYLPPDQIQQRPNSIGKAIPDVQILVLDEAGRDCPAGVVGELVHRGGCITRGYWNDPKNTSERFRAHPDYPGETLVYSGDLVVKDSDGYITFVNRKDGMLKTNGIRISPTEIEEVSEQHENIVSSVVFGIENIEIGHDLVLSYISKDLKPIPQSELVRFLKSKLPVHMVPKYIVHHENFSTTGNQGKINRTEVRELTIQILGL